MERCTGALNLPFAARRLFDDEGREHFTLKDLSRDQLVYITCGEAWIDPHISKAEAQRRFLLTNLASDLAQIRQFCALRDTEGKKKRCPSIHLSLHCLPVIKLMSCYCMNDVRPSACYDICDIE